MLKNLFKSIRAGRASRINEDALRLWKSGDLAGAELLFRQALAANPSFASSYSNLGMVLWQGRRFDEGMTLLRKAVELDPRHAGARVNLANALVTGNAAEKGIAQYREALRLDPENSAAHFNILMPLLDTCDWESVEAETNLLVSRWREPGGAAVLDCIAPHLSLLVPIPPDLRLQVARHHAARSAAQVAAAPQSRRTGSRNRGRLRIGYVSADFRDHATAHLTAGLFEQHDRGRFEVFAYSFGLDDGSEYRRRLVAAFDHFVDVRAMSHHAAAQRIAGDGIDILVDL